MKFNVIIPARYASQRLPGKPLADIAGKTMIERVYLQAKKSQAQEVWVATDHQAIYDVVTGFGGKVVMTREDHASGTDRLEEVVNTLNLNDEDIVVNVQGDEPLIPPEVINQVASNLDTHKSASIATVSEPVTEASVYTNPNVVKVVSDVRGYALYFSRAPLPWHRDNMADYQNKTEAGKEALTRFLNENNDVQKHIGIYAYRVGLLRQFVTWPAAMLENVEKLEQLRAMANGQRIHVAQALKEVPGGVDTEEDLLAVRKLFSN